MIRIEPKERLNVYQLLRHPFILDDSPINSLKLNNKDQSTSEVKKRKIKDNESYYMNTKSNLIDRDIQTSGSSDHIK